MISKGLVPHRTYFTVIRQRTLGAGFYDDACKEFYLRRLLHCQNAFQVQLHAYLLMERKIFLMFTPLTPLGFRSYIKFLNRRYSNYYLVRFERCVQSWQDKTPVCELPNDNLVRDCQKFIERFALEDTNCIHPGEYRYSSYCANAFQLTPSSLQRHSALRKVVSNDPCALEGYRRFIAAPFRTEYERFLQSRLLSGRPLLRMGGRLRLEKHRALTKLEKSGTIAKSR